MLLFKIEKKLLLNAVYDDEVDQERILTVLSGFFSNTIRGINKYDVKGCIFYQSSKSSSNRIHSAISTNEKSYVESNSVVRSHFFSLKYHRLLRSLLSHNSGQS